MNKHDPYCKAYYPALTDPETCTWCYVIREVRVDEYLKAWNEGFEIGFGEGREMSLNEYEGYMSLNKDKEEDIDIAHWQGYNNAMVEKTNDDT